MEPASTFNALRTIVNDEYPITRAAAMMTAQLGDICANCTPAGDRQAPPKPRAAPSFGKHVFARMCVTAPDKDVGIMVNSDVAVAERALMPNASRKSGSMIIPPPTPSRPESIPMNKPRTAPMANTANMLWPQ